MTGFKRVLSAALVLGLLGVFSLSTSAQEAKQSQDIDVALCLDVSGSMGGLIQSAKNKLWDIVNELAKAKPTPNLRVALYSYGHSTYDPKLGWVKKELDLTNDLDMLYQRLFALTINGGTEYATRVCRDAVRDLQWSPRKDALKLIFVCGNEPAAQDPVVSLKEAADLAISKGIVINPIYCGNPEHSDGRDWLQYASLSGGRFAAIDHNKSHVVRATPMDKELAVLGVKLNETYLCYGKDGAIKAENQKAQTANSVQAGAGVAAGRAIALNSPLYRAEGWDLVDKCKIDPNFDITKVPEAELSEEMRKMTPAQRVAHVKEMAGKRETLQKQISELTAKRQKFIAAETKRNPSAADRTFDAALRETLRVQAAVKGIIIPKE